ncbi:RNase adapter RapZ [Oecophyllibacter saccharovorans]|uniref:RNase adapter RapZ n=1 Tax=Oecophyllibacter saccharovorans TaxID=2558360 RepID=A0A506ULT1_9PROT|nr:RNase adapter RapZ [Oecophyllibacter saccharovorans]TPW34192.1 RNase adapter RapZ [Oecophyllibacter saccharovorans]
MKPVTPPASPPVPACPAPAQGPSAREAVTGGVPTELQAEERLETQPSRRIFLVSGLSGAGKASILRMLEDLGCEVVDNPPLDLFDALTLQAQPELPDHLAAPLAIGIDVRSRGFEAAGLMERLARLRARPGQTVQLIYATAEDDVLLRRFTATRRRHPLATGGNILSGITRERQLLAPLREAADLVVDTSDLPLPDLRRLIGARFGDATGKGLALVIMSFAYPAGLPREADMVFDVRFLRNPHYDDELRPGTGLDRNVADYVKADPFFEAFYGHLTGLLETVVPRFVEEGKKYVTIAFGCSGGRHRSVTLAEAVAQDLAQKLAQVRQLASADSDRPGGGNIGLAQVDSVMILHRELARQGQDSWRWAVAPNGLPALDPAEPV